MALGYKTYMLLQAPDMDPGAHTEPQPCNPSYRPASFATRRERSVLNIHLFCCLSLWMLINYVQLRGLFIPKHPQKKHQPKAPWVRSSKGMTDVIEKGTNKDTTPHKPCMLMFWDQTVPCLKTQLKLGFETAGSWLTRSDQLPARHGLAGWPGQTSSQLDMV